FMPVMGYEDWDFWIRAGILGSKFYRIPQGLFYYRDLPDSMIKNTEKKNELATSYVISKHAQTYSKYLFEIGKEYSYLKRKPLRYLLKRIFSKKG
ncbi:MAG TPA: hypothetical protein VL947_04620, partial [Cytophagales bacterium]|nr:hypothetical protein [Cytophagales bacterium]